MTNYSNKYNKEDDAAVKEDKNILKGFLKKGGIKSLILIVVLLIIAVMFFNLSTNNSSSTVASNSNEIGFTMGLDYIRELEAKVNNIVKNIRGAGTVSVMISISSSPHLEIAENVEEKTVSNSSGSTTTTKTEPIIVKVNGEESPLILKEVLPTINGVVVVSSGAKDIAVRLNIITAVSTALGIDSKLVEVFVGE